MFGLPTSLLGEHEKKEEEENDKDEPLRRSEIESTKKLNEKW
jgi:hypothetical protein